MAAAKEINRALENGWRDFKIGKIYELESIAKSHDVLESGSIKGRILLKV